MFVGLLSGTPIFSYISDKCGRKIAGLSTAVTATISWLIIILGSKMLLIYVARFVAGLSAAGVLLTVPIYVGEISEDSIRGALGTCLPIFAHAGILFSFAAGPHVPYHDFAIMCLGVSVAYLVAFMWIPETPVYLMGKGEVKKAKRSLKWLRGGKLPEEELTRMSLLLRKIQDRNSARSSIKDLLLDPGMRKALVTGTVVSATQILSGLYVILSYNAVNFKMTGSDLPTVTVATVLLTATILACPLMDRAGRKTLLISSEIVMGICLTLMAAYFYLQDQGVDLGDGFLIPVVCFWLHLFSFGGGVAPVNMVLLSEIFLPHVRSACASICTFVMALLACVITTFYSDVNNAIGIHGPFWFVAVCCFLSALFATICIPETKNRNVNSIYAELSGREPSIIPVKISYDMRQIRNEDKL
jgi:SP family facilitated glucose transporter-like MFS transporter 8